MPKDVTIHQSHDGTWSATVVDEYIHHDMFDHPVLRYEPYYYTNFGHLALVVQRYYTC